MRNSVVNGMGLCGVQVDKCINSTTRSDGKKAYYARNDVWIDFNSRVIQPQYYSFVLTKTGLTPNQAENTCWLLDRNVYGSSFTAVDSKGAVTSEYNNGVQSYNGQGGSNTKGNPMGAGVNKNGLVDAQRGHYARWDATKGECLVRVAAYNKDDLITNEWFGGIGDKQPAEVWKKAGESFSCEKDTFGFGLRNNTKTAALASGIGIVGGAGIGAGIGALAAHNQYEDAKIKWTKENCGLEEFRDLFERALKENGSKQKINAANCSEIFDKVGKNDELKGKTELSEEETEQLDTSLPSTDVIVKTMKNLNDTAMGKGKGALTGAAIGGGVALGVGGIATAITAFVESNNIQCRVGDGLDSVGFGKSGRVKSLKDYYVEWNLRLPDTVMPQQTVTECNSWNTACNSIANIADCAMAVVNYQPEGATRSTQVEAACAVSGNVCVANNPIAVSQGACM
jgi:hypothetical protein